MSSWGTVYQVGLGVGAGLHGFWWSDSDNSRTDLSWESPTQQFSFLLAFTSTSVRLGVKCSSGQGNTVQCGRHGEFIWRVVYYHTSVIMLAVCIFCSLYVHCHHKDTHTTITNIYKFSATLLSMPELWPGSRGIPHQETNITSQVPNPRAPSFLHHLIVKASVHCCSEHRKLWPLCSEDSWHWGIWLGAWGWHDCSLMLFCVHSEATP